MVKDTVLELVAPTQARPSAAIKSRLSFPYLQSRHLRESSANTLDSVYVLGDGTYARKITPYIYTKYNQDGYHTFHIVQQDPGGGYVMYTMRLQIDVTQ